MTEEIMNLSGLQVEGALPKSKQRQPKEAAEGVNTSTFPRAGYLGKPPGAVSLTEITIEDLLSEGRIDGIVSGYHTYVGTAGKTGWTSAALTVFDNAPETSIPWLRSVYWNQVPVVNPENQFNFTDIDITFTPGLPNGVIASNQIANETTSVRPIGERLRYGPDFNKVYRLLNKNIKAVEVNIRVGQLSRTETSKKRAGDLIDTEVKYNIYYRPIFVDANNQPSVWLFAKEESVLGKISQGYIRSTRINLFQTDTNFSNQSDFIGYEIKIERKTPDSTTVNIRNQTFVDSIVEVFGDTFLYPHSALIGSRFSAEYFSQVPNRTYEVKGLQVRIPDTYSPLTRSYSPNNGDDWEGDFKTDGNGNIVKQWTDNPAWCYFDLLTNRRYGLGKYITGHDLSVDKWTLYEIGRYCDVLVSDGYGGLEPRFSCNLVINEREEAIQVVNNMASIFRGMIYYGGGSIFTTQDAPSRTNVFMGFTNANVENGDFSYSSSSKKVRHTVAIVRYNDKRNFYKPAIEYVEDVDGIRRYGIREIELPAYGCTSRGQAVRFGRWALLTETSETEMVNFVAGFEGSLVRPGDIIQISDYNRQAKHYAGRTYQIIDPNSIVLDTQLPNITNSQTYTFHLFTPTYSYDPINITDLTAADYTGIRRPNIQKQNFLGSQVTTVQGSDDVFRSRIDFDNNFDSTDYSLTGNLIWMVDSVGVNDPAYQITDLYRVVKIEEQEPLKYSIAAIEHNIHKYNQIESGLNFATQTLIDTIPAGPTDLTLSVRNLSENSRAIDLTWTQSDLTNVSKFFIYAKKDADFSAGDVNTNEYLINIVTKDVRTITYIPNSNGIYYFRVYAASSKNTKSTVYAENNQQIIGVNLTQDLIVQSLRLDDDEDPEFSTEEENIETNDPGSRQEGTFTSAEPTFLWQVGLNSNVPPTFALTGVGYRVTIREPSLTNTPTNNVYFEDIVLTGRFDDLSYTFSFDDNLSIGPYRKFDVVVEAVDTHTKNSAAGGNYVANGDSNFTNSFGYDIFTANNPPIDNFKLTDVTPQSTDAFITEQWLDADGSVKLWVKEGVPPDWAGGRAFIYTGFESFTKNEAIGTQTTNKNITKIDFVGSGDNGLITIPTGITGYNSVYLSIAPIDFFDLARYEENKLNNTDLFLSNVVKIQKRLGFNDKLLFYAWIEVSLDYTNQTLSDWTKTSAGISSITFTEYNDALDNNAVRFKHNINFSIPLPSTNYVVVGTQPTTKNQDGFICERFQGRHFFGILHNGS